MFSYFLSINGLFSFGKNSATTVPVVILSFDGQVMLFSLLSSALARQSVTECPPLYIALITVYSAVSITTFTSSQEDVRLLEVSITTS